MSADTVSQILQNPIYSARKILSRLIYYFSKEELTLRTNCSGNKAITITDLPVSMAIT